MDDHLIDPAVRAEIDTRLAVIEAEHDVRVLFACESGSRGWGFASPDSDYDVRFLYVHPLPWYLQVSAGREVIELPISGDLDMNGWELRKALGLLKKGNATLIEWLDSPVIYRADERFLHVMRDAARLTHRARSTNRPTPCWWTPWSTRSSRAACLSAGSSAATSCCPGAARGVDTRLRE